MSDKPVAVLDIGSNSVRLVAYERLTRSLTPLFNEKATCGLGKGVARTGRLSNESVDLAVNAIRRFAALNRQLGVERLYVLATAAAREAENGPEFVEKVRALTGVEPRILDGAEEARGAAHGAIAGLWKPDGIVGDMGGGSLELVPVNGRRVGKGVTFPLGGLRLQNTSKSTVSKAKKIAREALSDVPQLRQLEGRAFYAVGGTWRALVQLYMEQTGYPLHVAHGYSVDAGDIHEFTRTVIAGSVETLEGIDSVSKSRRALLPYGAAVLNAIIKIGKPDQIVVSAYGLREGYLYDQLDGEARERDPLLEGASQLGAERGRSPEFARELIPFTRDALRAVGLDETSEERRLREAACLLTDVAWRAHPDYRAEQSFDVIAHAPFAGVDHPGRVFLALAVSHRHAGSPDEEFATRLRELVPQRYRARARAAGSAFRVAYNMAGGQGGVVPDLTLTRRGERLILSLPERLGDLVSGKLESRLNHLAGLGGLSAEVRLV